MPTERQQQDTNDETLIRLWLHGRSEHTQAAYRRDVAAFLAFAGCELRAIGLVALQAWADNDGMQARAVASRARSIAAVKSLFAFAHRLGYLPFDTAAPLRSVKLKDTLAERILEEPDVQRMLALETNPRNAVLLRLLYAAGVRVSEVCGLTWADLAARSEGQGQATVYGKGGKTRAIVLPATVYAALLSIKPTDKKAEATAPVFASRKRRNGQAAPLDPSQVLRIVRAAAVRAGIDGAVSPHWLRHAHASHSLDRGAPISLVQATLGHSSMATTGRYTHARPSDISAKYLVV